MASNEAKTRWAQRFCLEIPSGPDLLPRNGPEITSKVLETDKRHLPIEDAQVNVNQELG